MTGNAQKAWIISKDSSKTRRAGKPPSVLCPQTKSSKITRSSPSEVSPTKTSSGKASPTKATSKRRYDSSVFGYNLPSRYLHFPESGNVTAIEQLMFLTETVRSHDPLNRLVQHGMDNTTFTLIVNQCRTFPKYPLSTNSACIMLQNTMRDWGHKDWTFGKHESGLFQCLRRDEDDLTFEEMEMDGGDSLKPKGKGGRNTENIPFEALATNVTRLPDGDDALDLTSCVVWALNNPNSGLLYPRDFQWLTDQLDGAKPLLPANYDRQAFERWNISRKAQKTLSISTSLAISKAEAEYKSHTTKEKRSAAAKAHTAAKAKLAELKSAGEALVTVDNDVTTIHQDRIPTPAEGGPDPEDIAEYLAQYMSSTRDLSATANEDNALIIAPSHHDQFYTPQDHDQEEDEELVEPSPPLRHNDNTAGTADVVWNGEWTPSFELPDGYQRERLRPGPPTGWYVNTDTGSDEDFDHDVPIGSIETDLT